MSLGLYPKTPKTKRRMVSMRMAEQAIEWLDYLKTFTNAPGREAVLEQLIHDAYVELQDRIKAVPAKDSAPPKRR